MKPTVLIVDNEETVRRTFQAWLSALFPDCAFLTAKSGEECLKLLAQVQPSALLMDIRMPGMSGIETLREIRNRGASVEVVMLTAHDDNRYRQEAALAGARAYILKEEAWRMLPGVLRDILGQQQSDSSGSPSPHAPSP